MKKPRKQRSRKRPAAGPSAAERTRLALPAKPLPMMAVAPVVEHDDITAVALLMMPILLIAMALIGTGSARLRLAWIPSPSYSIAAADKAPHLPALMPSPVVPPLGAATAIAVPPALVESPGHAIHEVTPAPTVEAALATPQTTPRATPGDRCLPEPPTPVVRADAANFGFELAKAAEAQIGKGFVYTAAYRSMAYPMGDIPSIMGACSDVIIRAYRALGFDLQRLIHEAHIGGGDTNIDHRRTDNLRQLFSRAGASLPISSFPEDYLPGDIITYYRPFSRVSRAHIAIVSNRMAPTHRPMIVHNRGYGPMLEDALFVDKITGHYRWHPAPPSLPTTVALSSHDAVSPRLKNADFHQ